MEAVGLKYSPKLVTVSTELSIAQAYTVMRENKIRHLPVVNKDGIVGILSDRDIQRAMKVNIEDMWSVKVMSTSFDPSHIAADFMSWPVETVSTDAALKIVLEKLLSKKVSALLLVASHQEVTGIVTTDDLLSMFHASLEKQEAEHSKMNPLDAAELALFRLPIAKLLSELSSSGI